MKSYFIKTFGCQMNVADSETMAGMLASRGLTAASSWSAADILVVNTCTIRQKAEDKAYSELGRFAQIKKRNGLPVVVAAGCVSRKEGARILDRLPGVDVIIGPSRLGLLLELIDRRLSGGKPVVDVEDRPAASPVGSLREAGVSAFVTIMRGCDNHCAYCVVPSVRGAETSRPPGEIEREVLELVDRGYGEVTLLGQNVNSYGKGLGGAAISFPDLLERLDRRTGIGRLRFTTSHPKDFGPALAAAMRDLPSVCEALHLPIQAGSDRILAAMNRGYTSADYREKVAVLREIVPGVVLTTDIIVGFPLEEEADFEETVRLVRETEFAGLFAFKFSPRAGTPAAALPDAVPPDEKDRRLQVILSLQKEITLGHYRALVGSRVEVLVEGESKTDPSRLTGRTRGNQVVNFPGHPGLVGKLIEISVTAAVAHSLLGEVLAPGATMP